MRTIAFVLTMIATMTPGHAHATYRHEQHSQTRIEDGSGMQGARPRRAAPVDEGYECNGGPCTLTGGPPGGPNQS